MFIKRVDYDVSVFGIPLDTGTTYRAGTRFGAAGHPQKFQLCTETYYFEMGVDLREQITMCDLGGRIRHSCQHRKSLRPDQPRRVPRLCQWKPSRLCWAGDHSIGYPCVRGIAPHIDGDIGIFHIDRHVDTQEKDMDERMHTTPWFHAHQY